MLAGKVPKNPSELLSSKKMKQLISSLKARFDYIFIDTPPVMPLADACILGSIVDGAIIIIQAGKTQRDMVMHVEHRLHQARTNIVGYIMTNVEYHLPHYLYKYVHQYGTYESYGQKNGQKKQERKEVIENAV